jgi:hypothetical protein
MVLDPLDVVRRLAHIRYVHSLGIEQSRLPDPLSSTALLMFHDAVESFLLMTAEHLGAPAIQEFEKYWDALRPPKLSGGVDLPVQQGMKRLNRQRVALKHHGSQPNQTTIELIKSDTDAFLTAASLLVFGQDYNAVSMSSVIPQKVVRELAVQADTAAATGDYLSAMIALGDAWEELFNPRPPTTAFDDSSPLRFGPTIKRTLSRNEIAAYLYQEAGSRRHPRRNEDIGRQIAEVTDVARALQVAGRVTAIGVDYAEYLRFHSLTPRRDDFMNGRRTYRAPATYAPTHEHVAFCMQFVVSAALRFAAADAQLATPPWIDGTAPAWQTPWQTIKEVPGR